MLLVHHPYRERNITGKKTRFEISIVIVNWNGEQWLGPCIKSLAAQKEWAKELIVVDNNSTDSSLATIPAIGIPTIIIRNSSNEGYVRAINRGIRATKFPFVCTLNNDMIAESGWLDSCAHFLESNADIAAISSRQMQLNNPGTIDGLYHSLDSSLTPQAFGCGLPFAQSLASEFTQAGYVLSANGGSAIYRKDAFSKSEGFCTEFDAYLEEVDLCLQLALNGKRAAYVPNAVVYHAGSASFGKTPLRQYYLRERNRLWFLYRNFPARIILRHLPGILLMEARVFRLFWLKHKQPDLHFKARIDAFAGMKKFSENRKIALTKWKQYDYYLTTLLRKKHLPIES